MFLHNWWVKKEIFKKIFTQMKMEIEHNKTYGILQKEF